MKPRNNIADLISDNATNAPNQVCLVESKKGDGSDLVYRQITYGNFAEQVNQATTRLTAMGIEPGMKTLIAMPATPDFFALVFALLKTGAVPVFIDPRIGISNLRLCLRELQPDVLIGSLKARFLLRLLTNIKIKLSSTSCLQGRTTTLFPSYQPQTKGYGPRLSSPVAVLVCQKESYTRIRSLQHNCKRCKKCLRLKKPATI